MELEIYKTHSTICGTFECLAAPELKLGRPGRAVILLSAANSLRNKKAKSHLHPVHEREIQQNIKDAADKLDKSDFQEAWEKGQKMTFQEVVDFALEEDNLI